MLEGQVAFYLNKYLGSYVYGLDAQSLKVSVFKGDVQLNNLHLKPEALNALNLPITVKAGLLGSLTLKVTTRELMKTAVRTWRVVRSVCLLCLQSGLLGLYTSHITIIAGPVGKPRTSSCSCRARPTVSASWSQARV